MVKCDIKSAIKTDHSLISSNFNNPKEIKKGPGLWKCNKHLLCDESFVGCLINLIKEYNDKNLKWEFLKCFIRQFCIVYSKKTKPVQVSQEYELQMRRDLLENLPLVTTLIFTPIH